MIELQAWRMMILIFDLQAWRRRKNYDPMAAAGKKKEVALYDENNNDDGDDDDCDDDGDDGDDDDGDDDDDDYDYHDHDDDDDGKVCRKQSSSSLRSVGGKSPREATETLGLDVFIVIIILVVVIIIAIILNPNGQVGNREKSPGICSKQRRLSVIFLQISSKSSLNIL